MARALNPRTSLRDRGYISSARCEPAIPAGHAPSVWRAARVSGGCGTPVHAYPPRRDSPRRCDLPSGACCAARDSTRYALSGFAEPTRPTARPGPYILGRARRRTIGAGGAVRRVDERYPARTPSLAPSGFGTCRSHQPPRQRRFLYQSESTRGPQRTAARFWLARCGGARDSAQRAVSAHLGAEDSLGYYGMRAGAKLAPSTRALRHLWGRRRRPMSDGLARSIPCARGLDTKPS